MPLTVAAHAFRTLGRKLQIVSVSIRPRGL